MKRRIFPFVCAILLAVPCHAAEVAPGDDLQSTINALQPGDELILRGGSYRFNSGFRITVNGASDAPIMIRAADGETPVIFQESASHNVIEVFGSSYVTLEGIEFTGGSHGVRLMDSDYVTVRECEIHDTGDVALSANSGGTYTGLHIVRNHIHHTNNTGEGMYLGCNSDGCRVEQSLIEGNYIHHTNGPTVDQGDGIELKEGSSGNTIRNNVIHDTRFPGILTYSTVGNGPPNVIEGNVVWNTSDSAIQVAADAVIRNNIVLGAPVSFQPHQAGVPSNIEFVHNTLVVPGTAVYVRNVSGPVLIANNAVYSQFGAAINLVSGDRTQVTVSGNVGTGGLVGASSGYQEGINVSADFLNGHFGVPPIDLYPAVGSPLIGAADPQYATIQDFNENPRSSSSPDAGAYSFETSWNPGWTISEGFKTTLDGAGGIPKPPVLEPETLQ